MSQPRQPTPSSPTPSKSSLRRTSGAQNPSQRSLIPPPSPHFEDQPAVPVRYSPRSPPNQTLEYESDEDDEPLIYPEVPNASTEESYFPYPDPERPFQPFFTLIEDGLTSEHHHPSVHYIFADDDAELITEAALRSLEQEDQITYSNAGDRPDKQSHVERNLHSDSRLPYTIEGVREHYLIFDVHPISQAQAQQQATQAQSQSQAQSQPQAQTQSQSQNANQPYSPPSYAITSFTSLSPDWQVSSASITSAPTMGDTPGEDEGLMLRIEGRGLTPLDDLDPPDRTGKAAVGQGEDRESQSLEDMIERFQSRLGEVRRLIENDGGITYRGIGIGGATAGGVDETGDSGYPPEGEVRGYGLEEQD